ncbi:MAG: ankyrin repeat domain-containing protein [Victivallales bacterium]|nr:ankyrin repeat domain-containing protein [Victivallales bacterium]
MKKFSTSLVVFLIAIFLGGCASVDNSKKQKEQNAAIRKLEKQGITFDSDSFIEAAKAGKLEIVKLYVKGGMDVNVRHSETALGAACFAGHLDVVKFLIDKGAYINPDEPYRKPLMYAIVGKSFKTAKYLIEKGADVNSVCKNNASPLYVAAEIGNPEIVELLIKHGAEVDYIQPFVGRTPLAAQAFVLTSDSIPTVEKLVKAGADMNFKDPTGMSVLDWAAARRKFDMVKYLIEHGAHPNNGYPKDYASRVFLCCIAWGSPKTCKYLLDQGISPNAKAFGKVPLVIWCAKNLLENMAVTLIDYGASPNETYNGRPLIDYAIANNQKKLVKKIDPDFDLSTIHKTVSDPNIQPQSTQVEKIMGGKYYKVQKTKSVQSAVKKAQQANETLSEAAKMRLQSNAKGQKKEKSRQILEALDETGNQKKQGSVEDYPIDRGKIESDIDSEIKKIEAKFSTEKDGTEKKASGVLGDDESNWYDPDISSSPDKSEWGVEKNLPDENPTAETGKQVQKSKVESKANVSKESPNKTQKPDPTQK